MAAEKKVNGTVVRLIKDDITLMDVDAFVFYAQHDLALGSGFGAAISGRGGPSIQKEVTELGPLKTTEVVASAAGRLKAKQILHAVGPRFQEPEAEAKLAATVDNLLKLAKEKEITTLAVGAMGSGFYGIPPAMCAKVLVDRVRTHLKGGSQLTEVTFCVQDERDHAPFQAELAKLA